MIEDNRQVPSADALLKRTAKAYVVETLHIDPGQYHLSGDGAWVQIAARLVARPPSERPVKVISNN